MKNTEHFEEFMRLIGGVKVPSTTVDVITYELAKLRIQFITLAEAPTSVEDIHHTQLRTVKIWEDVWQNQPALVKSRLMAMIGKGKKIHARQTEVVRLDKKAATDFLQLNHLQRSTSAYYKYGLLHQNKLVAVATFSKSRVMQDGPVYYRSYELERFASTCGLTVTGGLGKLISHFIANHHAVHLMTYVDADWGNGEGYLKLGFKKMEQTPPQSFWIHPHEMIRHYPHRSSLTDEEWKARGYLKIYNSGNVRFVLDKRSI